MGLAVAAAILADISKLWVDGTTQSGLTSFGYFTTLYWSLSYLVLAPAVGALSVLNLRLVWRRSYGRLVSLALVLATVFMLYRGYAEYTKHSRKPAIHTYCQWNDIYNECERKDPAIPHVRLVLIFVAYLHYLVVATLFLAQLISVPTYVILRLTQKKRTTEHERNTATWMTRWYKGGVLGFLFHVLFLRSSKADMYFRLAAKSPECDDFTKPTKCLQPYFETVSRGIAFYFVITAIVVLLIVVLQGALVLFRKKDQDRAILNPPFDLVVLGFESLGKNLKLIVGVLLVGLALPPPTQTILFGFMLAAPGLYLIKQSFAK